MSCCILLVDDEPLILMDLEFAAEDVGCDFRSARGVDEALDQCARHKISVAVLDVNLGAGTNCVPIAQALDAKGIPYVLHSGDLDRQNEVVRSLEAELIPKPASADRVIERALALGSSC